MKSKAVSAVPRALALAHDLIRLSRPEGRARAAKVASVIHRGFLHSPATLVLGMPALRLVQSPPTPNPPMTCHTRWGYTNRAVPTATVVWSEKELPEAPGLCLLREYTHGEDPDLAMRGTSSSQKKRHRKHPRPSSSSSSTTSTDSESSSQFSRFKLRPQA